MKVGDKIVVIKDDLPYLRAGEVCTIIEESEKDYFVQSERVDKFQDGKWYADKSNVGPTPLDKALE